MTFFHSGWWWLFFACMWTIALCGVVSKIWLQHRINSATVWSYIFLGWLTMFPTIALIGTLPIAALGWVVAGGLCYTLGTIFFIRDDPRYHCHGIWHLCVMAGSSCHYLAVFFFVAQ